MSTNLVRNLLFHSHGEFGLVSKYLDLTDLNTIGKTCKKVQGLVKDEILFRLIKQYQPFIAAATNPSPQRRHAISHFFTNPLLTSIKPERFKSLLEQIGITPEDCLPLLNNELMLKPLYKIYPQIRTVALLRELFENRLKEYRFENWQGSDSVEPRLLALFLKANPLTTFVIRGEDLDPSILAPIQLFTISTKSARVITQLAKEFPIVKEILFTNCHISTASFDILKGANIPLTVPSRYLKATVSTILAISMLATPFYFFYLSTSVVFLAFYPLGLVLGSLTFLILTFLTYFPMQLYCTRSYKPQFHLSLSPPPLAISAPAFTALNDVD